MTGSAAALGLVLLVGAVSCGREGTGAEAARRDERSFAHHPPVATALAFRAAGTNATTACTPIRKASPWLTHVAEAMTTRRLMMTTALKELYAFLDAWQVDDAGKCRHEDQEWE